MLFSFVKKHRHSLRQKILKVNFGVSSQPHQRIAIEKPNNSVSKRRNIYRLVKHESMSLFYVFFPEAS